MNRPGFTMIEIIAVLVILALLATAAMLVPSQWMHASRLADAADRIVYMDRVARQFSQRSGESLDLVFDIETRQIYRSRLSNEARQDGHRQNMPGGFEIGRIIIAGSERDRGRVNIPFTAQGHTPSYAIEIKGPDGQTSWLLIAGLSGQVLSFSSEEEVQHVFKHLAS